VERSHLSDSDSDVVCHPEGVTSPELPQAPARDPEAGALSHILQIPSPAPALATRQSPSLLGSRKLGDGDCDVDGDGASPCPPGPSGPPSSVATASVPAPASPAGVAPAVTARAPLRPVCQPPRPGPGQHIHAWSKDQDRAILMTAQGKVGGIWGDRKQGVLLPSTLNPQPQTLNPKP
jgi:hypothetical protein